MVSHKLSCQHERFNIPKASIRYVNTNENPADILTREISAEELLKSKLWWYATKWIISEDWKKQQNEYELHPEVTDMNSAQVERTKSLVENCFENTPGNFHDKKCPACIFWLNCLLTAFLYAVN